MSKPTWSQVLKAAGDAGRARIEEGGAGGCVGLLEAQLRAVVALFGGVAPEPVGVPVVVIHRGSDGRMPVSWISTDACEYGLRDEQQLAIAARSNAWEQLRALAADLNGCLDGSASVVTWPLAQQKARLLLFLMTAAEMGVGPKEGARQ